jgi:hypothetical protein
MSEIIHFEPNSKLTAKANLSEFIALCRDRLTALGREINFEENTWNVSGAIKRKGRKGVMRLHFTRDASLQNLRTDCMAEPFLSFSKAYIRYQHAMQPVQSINTRLAILRVLEASLVELGLGSQPTECTPEVFNHVAQRLQQTYTANSAYGMGAQLEVLADFMARKCLLSVPLTWRNPIKRPVAAYIRVGQDFDNHRNSKLPSEAALRALPEIYRAAREPAHVLVTSVLAILCSAPDRINEVLLLDENCEVSERIPSTGEMAYGLRWFSSKGADPMIKWVINSMADVIIEAVSKIRMISEEARNVARWYENNPGKMFLPSELEHFRGRNRLSMPELGEILFSDKVARQVPGIWCNNHGIPIFKEKNRRSVAFVDVEQKILSMLPVDFPMVNTARGLRYSSALCVTMRNTLHAARTPYRCVIESIGYDDIANRLSTSYGGGEFSIFAKFGYTEDDGSPIHLKTHAFRHFLNTLAQAGGLSQLDIARWSGRKNIYQNEVYDHVSDRDIIKLLRQTVCDKDLTLTANVDFGNKAILSREEFAKLKVPTAHTTEFGFCIHDFSMLPCQIFRDCLNCDEQVCLKGDSVREKNIRRHRDETRALLLRAEQAQSEGDMGADRWVAHQQITLSRLEQLCAILDDPMVPSGAVIQLSKIIPASKITAAQARRNIRHQELQEKYSIKSVLDHVNGDERDPS